MIQDAGYSRQWALSQIWLFWIASILGAVLAGLVYRSLFGEDQS
jgi:aquaporin Z